MPNAKAVKVLFKNPNRAPEGWCTAYREDTKGKFGQPSPGDWHVFFDDFDFLPATNKFTNVVVGTGTSVTTTAQDGGVLSIVNSAANNDVTSVNQTTATFLPQFSTRSLIAEEKFEVDDATNAQAGFGLIASPATLNPFTFTEGIAITKPAAGTTFTIQVKKAGTTSATSAFGGVAMPVNTQVTWGFAFKGPAPGSQTSTTGLEFLFLLDLNDTNGPRYQSLFVPTANVPTTILALSTAVQNGTAAARTKKVDYVFAAKDRFYQ